MTSSWLLVVAIVVGFPLVFGLFFSGVTFLVSLLGGWGRLAGRYRAPPGGMASVQTCSGFMGVARYSGVLRVGVAPEGLHLSVMVLFRAGHPPLVIPWQDIHDVEATSFLGMQGVRFRVGTQRPVTVRLLGEPAQAVLARKGR